MQDIRGKKGSQPKRQGRPTLTGSEEITARILSIATRLFLDQGYRATGMEEIAASAGVSKRTLYSRFPTKSGLFKDVIRTYADATLGKLPRGDDQDLPIVDRLYEACIRVMTVGLAQDVIAMERVLVAEAVEFPELAQSVEVARRQALAHLEAAIGCCVARHELRTDDPSNAAEHLFNLVVAPAIRRATLAISPYGVTEGVRAAARDGVTLFLRGYNAPLRNRLSPR